MIHGGPGAAQWWFRPRRLVHALGIAMRRLAFLLGIATVLISVCAVAQQQSSPRSAVDALKAARPNVAWDSKSSVVADVTCDGRADAALVGYEGNMVWLGVVPGASERNTSVPLTIGFPVGRHSQDSFCAVPVRIEVSPLECRNEDGALPGCKPVKGCSAFSMVDDACDSFHFYWDSSRNTLTWWRR